MASTISAGTSAGTALAFSGDTSGALQLQTNGTTTAVTISTAQVVTLAQPLPVASGGSGVTTSTGSGANVLGTSPTLTTPTISSLSSAAATALTLQSAGTTAITVDTSQNVKLTAVGTTIQNSSGRPILNQTGGVLQVVTFTTNTNFSTASSTPTDTQLTLSITLSSTSSKVLVLVHHADAGKAENAINGSVRLVRGSTVVFTPTGTIGRSDTTATNFSGGFDFHYLDSPATSGAVTYKTQAWTAENTARFYLGLLSTQHSITLMEIAA